MLATLRASALVALVVAAAYGRVEGRESCPPHEHAWRRYSTYREAGPFGCLGKSVACSERGPD